MEFEDAFKVFTKALREDKELFNVYKANIAMCFIDEVKKVSINQYVSTANNAAEKFLNMLINAETNDKTTKPTRQKA